MVLDSDAMVSGKVRVASHFSHVKFISAYIGSSVDVRGRGYEGACSVAPVAAKSPLMSKASGLKVQNTMSLHGQELSTAALPQPVLGAATVVVT